MRSHALPHPTRLRDLETREGRYREAIARSFGREGRVYAAPDEIADRMAEFQDSYADMLNVLHERHTPSQFGPVEALTDTIKLAAWALHEFVAIHPFPDGNGRLCRMLASHVLQLVAPFPVTLRSDSRDPAPWRSRYVDALRAADAGLGPSQLAHLAALLVEALHREWQELEQRMSTIIMERAT